MKKLLLLVCFLSITITSKAQYTKGGGGAFSIGLQTLSVDGLEVFYPEAPVLSTSNLTFGGYSYWQFDSWLVGFEGAGLYGSKVLEGDYEYSLGGGYFLVDFGYKILNRKNLAIYPSVGAGLGGVAYNINSKFTINLDDPFNERPVLYSGEYNWNNFVFDAGIRIEKLFGVSQEGDNLGGGLIGVELGYMFSPSSADWRTNTNATINGAEEFNMNGFYARLLIGGFGGY